MKSPTHLLNQCLQCGTKFDSAEQLANHVKKFCSGSVYGDAEKLEKRYQEQIRLKNSGQIPDLDPLKSMPTKNDTGPKNFDLEFKKQYDMAIQGRELEMQNELAKLKQDKAEIRLKKQKEEEYLADLMKEVEMKKERDLRARIEKEQIKKEIILLEKNKLSSLEQEKKANLEKLAAEREMLKKKEDQMINELAKLESDMRNLEDIRQQDMEKVNKNAELLKQKGRENYGVNEILIRERSEKVAELKMRREQLDLERNRIMSDLEKIKKGETVQKRNNYGLYAANQMLNDMNTLKNYGIGDARDKFQREEDRINQLKREQLEMVQKEHIFPEDFASPPTQINPNELTMRRSFQNLGTQIVSGTRQNLDDKKEALDEIAKMRDRYSLGGGNDPAFLQNLRKMEDFYRNQKLSVHPQNIHENENDNQKQFLNMISQKDNENKKLREQLELLKLREEKNVDANMNPNTFAIGDINLKLNGMTSNNHMVPSGKDDFSIFKAQKEFFLQNEIRSVDLSEEERTLVSLVAQEVDALRLLSQIPIGTELYRFKMDQFKELSTTRAEIEKIVQEQRLQKLRRDFEKKRREEDRKYENEKWVDDQRKNIIATRLRKDLQPTRFDQKYDPTEGFIIHWDYCLGVPKRNDSCQIVYGIYINGDEVYAPRLIDPHPCEIDTSITNRCIFGESHHILDIPSNSNALLIFEVQIFPNKDSPSPKLVSYGWTQLDLFDTRRELRRGKFKVPLYECPTDTNIDIEGIKYLNPVQNGVSWLYLRISYPNNDEYAKSHSIYPENTHMEYVIPQIHLRSFRPPLETQFVRPQPEYLPPQRIQQQPPMNQQPYQEPYNPSEIQEPQDDIPYNEPMPHQALNFPEPAPMKRPTRINEPKETKPNLSMNQTQTDMGKKGLIITIHSIKNHVAKSHLKVACSLLEEYTPSLDEIGNVCAFNTTVHNPLEQQRKDLSTYSAKSGMSNKAQGQDIVFKEEHRFLKDARKFLVKTRGEKNLYLNFQILEKPEPQSIQYNNQSVSYRNGGNSELANFGGMEYDLFGWYLFKLNKDNSINVGKFSRRLLAPPLISPPVDLTKLKNIEIGEGGESYGPEIEFSVDEFAYDQDDVNQAWGGNDDTRKSKKDKDKKSKKGLSKNDSTSIIKKSDKTNTKIMEEIPMDNRPYIPNTKSQYQDKTFEKGMGVDFYVDGCRFLPDNVTVVRVAVVIVNLDFDILHEAESNLPDFGSPTYNPTFNFKMELRSQYFSPTALAFISIDTIDKASNSVKIVGYSGINLFINRFSKKQPVNNSDSDIVLFSGNYQLPIFCEEPYRTKPFNMEKINDLERLPTASILVRIHRAELSKDGLRVLGKKDFKVEDWEKAGVMIPRPLYATGVYNNSLCPIRDSEKDLFKLRQTRDDRPVRESAQLLLGAMNINKEMNDDELFKFLIKQIQRNSNTGLIDLLYFARYRQEAGFKFSLDGLHNVPKAEPYVGLYMLNPPGGLYAENVDKRSVYLNSLMDWEGPLMSPRFLDDYVTFQNVKFDKNVHIIIDIRTVNLSKYPPQFTSVGWGLFPIFTPDGYVKSGIYQVPLIKGEITDEIARDFLRKIESDPWTSLLDEMKKNKKLKWLETTSAMVRLVDSQREGHFKNSWDYNRVIYEYLPKNKLQQYAYNNTADAKAKAGKKLVTIVPNKGNPQAYNRKITDSFVQNLELPQYQQNES